MKNCKKRRQEVCMVDWKMQKKRTLTVPLMPSWMVFSWHKPPSVQMNEEMPMRK